MPAIASIILLALSGGRRWPSSCTAFAVATLFSLARRRRLLRCGDSVCNKLTRQGTVQMAARLSPFLGPLIPDQYSWKQRSTCSSARACHTPAVPAPLPAVPESRSACRRVPGPSDTLSSKSTVPTLLRLLRSLLLRLCVSACCTRQAVPLHACRGAPQLLFRCIEDAVGQLQLPLWLLSIHLRINCHCHFSSLQLARSLRPPAPNQCFLEPGTSWSCCINLYVHTTQHLQVREIEIGNNG